MKTICSWCGRLLREGPPAPVSHGICAACRAKLLFEWRNRAASSRPIAGSEGLTSFTSPAGVFSSKVEA